MSQQVSQLTVIEANLFPPAPNDDWLEAASTERDVDCSDDIPPLPAHLAALIAARVHTAAQRLSLTPRPGLIVRIDPTPSPDDTSDWRNAQPLAVLLCAPTAQSHMWNGYLVAYETDYASAADLLLEDADAPLDPLAAMVQSWNPVRVATDKAKAALGELAPQRLAAVRELAEEYRAGVQLDSAPKPGSVVQRVTRSGQLVLTGTPLGSARDPRHHYQMLYRKAAAMRLQEALPPVTAAAPAWLQQIWDGLRTAAQAWQLPLEPVLQPTLGDAVAASPATQWRLGEWLNLRLISAPAGDALQIHATWQTVTPVVLELTAADGQVRQRQPLDAHHPVADLFVGTEERLTLRIRTADARLLFEAPFPELLPAIHHCVR